MKKERFDWEDIEYIIGKPVKWKKYQKQILHNMMYIEQEYRLHFEREKELVQYKDTNDEILERLKKESNEHLLNVKLSLGRYFYNVDIHAKDRAPWRWDSYKAIYEYNLNRVKEGKDPILYKIDDIDKIIELYDESKNVKQKELYSVRVYLTDNSVDSKEIYKYNDMLSSYGLKFKFSTFNNTNYYEGFNVHINSVKGLEREIKEQKLPLQVKTTEMRWARGEDYKKIHKSWFQMEDSCIYCGDKKNLQVDHIFPVSKLVNDEEVRKMAKEAGITRSDSPKNLITVCEFCNKAKGTMTTDAWIKPALKKKEQTIVQLQNELYEMGAIGYLGGLRQAGMMNRPSYYVERSKERVIKEREEKRAEEKMTHEKMKGDIKDAIEGFIGLVIVFVVGVVIYGVINWW